MSNPRPTFDGASYRPDEQSHRRKLSEFAERVNSGKINVVTDFTLTANVATTTLKDPRIGYYSAIILQPMTANAAASVPWPYVLQGGILNGSAVFNHANAATTDRTFRVVILG